jgi:hypothetical protein
VAAFVVTEDKKHSGVLQQLVESGKATPPAEPGSRTWSST